MKIFDYVAFFFLGTIPRIVMAFVFALTAVIAVTSVDSQKPKVEWTMSDVVLENCEVTYSFSESADLNCKIMKSE